MRFQQLMGRFVASFALCVMLVVGLPGNHAAFAGEDDDVERFVKMGGRVRRTEELPGKPVHWAWLCDDFHGDFAEAVSLLPPTVRALVFDGSNIKDAEFSKVSLSRFSDLQMLSLGFNPEITGQSLKPLASLPKLAWLILRSTSVKDDDLIVVNSIKMLSILDVTDCEISDRGIALLDLPELSALDLSGTQVSEAFPSSLKGCPKLMSLAADGTAASDKTLQHLIEKYPMLALVSFSLTSVTDEGIACLADAKELRGLFLNGTHITDKGIAGLNACSKLETLYVSGNPIEGSGFEQWKEHPNFRVLHASHTKLTPQGLASLAALPKLNELYLDSCGRLTEGIIDDFKQKRPDVDISWSEPIHGPDDKPEANSP